MLKPEELEDLYFIKFQTETTSTVNLSFIDDATWFFNGFQPDSLIGNTTTCFYGITNISFTSTQQMVSDVNNGTYDFFNKTVIVLYYVRHVSLTTMQCTSVVSNFVKYVYYQEQAQNGWVNYLLAFF